MDFHRLTYRRLYDGFQQRLIEEGFHRSVVIPVGVNDGRRRLKSSIVCEVWWEKTSKMLIYIFQSTTPLAEIVAGRYDYENITADLVITVSAWSR